MNNNALPTTGDNTDSKDPRAGWPRRAVCRRPGESRVRRIPSAIPISFATATTRQMSPMGIKRRGAMYIRMIHSGAMSRLMSRKLSDVVPPIPLFVSSSVVSRDNKYRTDGGRKCEQCARDGRSR